MLRKLACNATNSGAIDANGDVYVWGAGKYGLLGNPRQKNPIAKPIKLLLKSEQLVLEKGSDQSSYVATSISLGQYHAAVVVNDANTNSDFNPLLYASSILKEFKSYLKRQWEEQFKFKEKYGEIKYFQEEQIIENSLKEIFD